MEQDSRRSRTNGGNCVTKCYAKRRGYGSTGVKGRTFRACRARLQDSSPTVARFAADAAKSKNALVPFGRWRGT